MRGSWDGGWFDWSGGGSDGWVGWSGGGSGGGRRTSNCERNNEAAIESVAFVVVLLPEHSNINIQKGYK